MSKWIQHVKSYAAENNISYREAMSKAKASYSKGPTKSKAAESKVDEPKETSSKSTPAESPSTPPTPAVNWIQHVKNYAAEHGLSYKEAMSKAKDSYTKKPKAPRTAGAIKVYDKSNDEKKATVKSKTSKLVKNTLTAKEGRALILKIIPTEALSSRSVIKFLDKYDNDSTFRNNLLRMPLKGFKETVLALIFKGLGDDVDKLDREAQKLSAAYDKLIKKEKTESLTAAEKRRLTRLTSAIEDNKKMLQSISKSTAYLSSADFDVSADNLTAKILRPRNAHQKLEQIFGADKVTQYYYDNIPKYFITRLTTKRLSNIVDVANNVLAIQTMYPGLEIDDVDDDPFIQYMTSVINADSMYEEYDDLGDVYEKHKDDEDNLKEYMGNSLRNNQWLRRERSGMYRANVKALKTYVNRVKVDGKHSRNHMRNLLNVISDNVDPDNGIIQHSNVDSLIDPRDLGEVKRVMETTVAAANEAAVKKQIDLYNKRNDDKYTITAVEKDMSKLEDRFEKYYVQSDQDQDEDEDKDEDEDEDEDDDQKNGIDLKSALDLAMDSDKKIPRASKVVEVMRSPVKKFSDKKTTATAPSRIPVLKREVKPAAPRSSTPASVAFATPATPATRTSASTSALTGLTPKQLLYDDGDDFIAEGVSKKPRAPVFKFLKNKKPRVVGGAKKVKMTIYTK